MKLSRAFTLVEVLIGLALTGVLALAVFSTLHSHSQAGRAQQAAAEALERARYALATLEADIALAGYFGPAPVRDQWRVLRGGLQVAAILPAHLAQSATALAGVPPGLHQCGDNFAFDLGRALQADNNSYWLARNRRPSCAARGGARSGADTLTIRRASTDNAVAAAGRLQVLGELGTLVPPLLMHDGQLPAGTLLAEHRLELHDLQVRAYYVANDSDAAPGVPSLRVKSLTRVAGQPMFVDTEVIAGIEDLQVRWLVDGRWLDPDAAPATARIAAVRVWVLARGDTRMSVADARRYHYADRDLLIAGDEQHYGRVLLEQSIAVHNVAR